MEEERGGETLRVSAVVDVSVAEGAAGDAITTEPDGGKAIKSAECSEKIIFLDPTVEIPNVERLDWIHPFLLVAVFLPFLLACSLVL